MSDINMDGLSMTECANYAAQLTGIIKQAEKFKKQIVKRMLDVMDPSESRTAMFDGRVIAHVDKTRGSAGNGFKVKDPLAYGAWLHANGYDDDVYAAPLPTDVAKTRAFIQRVVEKKGGVLPDGVAVDGGTASTVRVSLEKDALDVMFKRNQLPSSMNLMLENGGVL